ncbi:MAG: glycosyltransferase, partial [Mycobacterium sp.]
MSQVVIIAVGSRGDVAPLTGVGVALQRAGHEVAVAAYTPFEEMIANCGLSFHELPADPQLADEGAEVSPMKSLAAFASPKGMRALGNDVLSAVADAPADVVMLSPFAEMVGHPLAEAKGIPSLGIRLQPLSATALYPPAIAGAWSAGPIGNRAAANAGAVLVDRLYGSVIADFRRQLGLT